MVNITDADIVTIDDSVELSPVADSHKIPIGNGSGSPFHHKISQIKAFILVGHSGDVFVLDRSNHTGSQTAETISDFDMATNLLISSQKGFANGLVPLDSNGFIPSQYLPGYLDDVLEYANLAAFPVTGEQGKIYVALDTNRTYRWSGSAYIEISPSAVISVNGIAGAVNLSTNDIPEGTNLYYTVERARDAVGAILQDSASISLTYDDDGETITAEIIPDGHYHTESIIIAISDETTALTTGTKATFRMPYDFTLTAIKASVTTAPTGAALIIDVKKNGTTIFSTKLSIDATEKTSVTAAAAAVLSTTAFSSDDEISISIDQIGSGTAGAGAKVSMIGHQ